MRNNETNNRGHEEWFTRLVRRWEDSMFVTAKRILGNSTDAQEARQNVLLNILRKPELVPDKGLEYWIRRCIINESLRLLRQRRADVRKNQFHSNADSNQSSNGFVSEPESALEKLESAEALKDALKQLPPDLRVLLTLRFDDELTIREIAEVVDKPHTTVQSQLQSAIDRLRRALAKFAIE